MQFFESLFYMAWRGIAIGLIISAPMGPVGMLCIQRTLDKGRRAGFYTGIGAALSDLFYSLLTGFGLSFIEEFLERNQNIIQLAGSAVLIAFGVYLFRKNPSHGLKKPIDETVSVKKNILGGFLFTFSNPLILFLTIGLFARFNFLLPEFHVWQYFTGFAFIFVGALIWWWFITFSVDKVRSHFNLRSMWLINKIIGVVIMLFAVVGIFTATTAIVNAQDIACWNSRRGFGPFSGGNPEVPNMISNETGDTLYLLTPVAGAGSVEFRCKVKNHRKGKGWGFVMSGRNRDRDRNALSGSRIFLDIRSRESDFDGISSAPVLDVEFRGACSGEGAASIVRSFSDDDGLLTKIKSGMSGPDPSGTHNFFRLVYADKTLGLHGGKHHSEELMAVGLADFLADSIGIYVAPGARVTIDEIRLDTKAGIEPATVWSDAGLLNDYLCASRDRLEGLWQILDRSLDESLLKTGGDYRLAMVKAEDGYDLIYMEGAKVNAPAWKPGMVKASLRPSGISGVWNVIWYDAMGERMSSDIKAQTDQGGTITIQFPYQNSQIRLYRSEFQPATYRSS